MLPSQSDHCAERLQTCVFCKLELPWKELSQHQLVCGSRTELCGDCGRYVTLRDQAVHELSCPATSAPPQTNSKPPSDASKMPERLWLKRQSSKHAFSFPLLRSQNQREVWELHDISSCRGCWEPQGACLKDSAELVVFSGRFISSVWGFQTPSELNLPLCVPVQLRCPPSDMFDDLDLRTFSAQRAPVVRRDLAASLLGRLPEGGDDINTCPHCHLALPIPTLLWHQVKLLQLMSHSMVLLPW